MGEPSVSVVIPTYNSAPFLPDAIDSVLSQTVQPHEVIVVDDGSTDHTADVLASYRGRIRTIVQQNGGPARARNAGILVSTGVWVAFLDADDWWFPTKLAAQVVHLEQDLVQLGGLSDTQQVESRGALLSELHTADFLGRLPFSISSLIARRSTLAAIGNLNVTHRNPGAEDRDLFLRLSLRGRSARVNTPIWHYRNHPAQGSRHAQRMHDSYTRVLQDFFRDHPEYCAAAGLAYAHLHLDTAWGYYDVGQRSRAIKHLLASLYYQPRALPGTPRLKMAARIVLGDTVMKVARRR